MPKMKTNSSAKKRFKVTAKGKVKFKQAYSRHMQMNKPKSMKRKARGTDVMIPGDERLVVRYLMPYEQRKKRRRKKESNRKSAANFKASKGAE
jgi:large subunit ribosomal protein L35